MLESEMENAETASGVTAPTMRLTAAALAASSALAACGGGGTGADPVSNAVMKPSTDQEAARFLLQAQFHASDEDIASLKALGYLDWLQQQYAMPYASSWDWMQSQGFGDTTDTKNFFFREDLTDHMMWHELIATPASVRKRIALALSEYFVVSVNGLEMYWRSQAAANFWDILCTHGLGNFRDLLEAVTLSPAMGKYLNMMGSRGPDGKGSQPDENYAREIMQLFTIGLVELEETGVPKRYGGLTRDTYTAEDIRQLAHAFTGYNLDFRQSTPITVTRVGQSPYTVQSMEFTRLPMWVQWTSLHSSQAVKVFPGKPWEINIDSGTAAAPALKRALDGLFNHPNLPPFFCKQMIQRLVTSNPSPAYVQRVVNVFKNNGQGVRGDLARVFAAILMDTEARTIVGGNESGKLREPMLRVVQWARSFGATLESYVWRVSNQSDPGTAMGQSPLRSPSVFNFFRPGYVPPNSLLGQGKVAPEFQLVNECTVAAYINKMQKIIRNGLPCDWLMPSIKATYAKELAIVTDATALVNRLNLILAAGQLSTATVSRIVNALVTTGGGNPAALTVSSPLAEKLNRIYGAVLLVMASPEYLIQK